MFGDFPPSSSETGVRFSAANFATARPVTGPPVNETLLTSGCPTRLSAVGRPGPQTTLKTPFGNPAASTSRANSSVDAEDCSDGFATIVFPVASAGPSFHVSRSNGEFHGMIAATTPSGSR